VADQLELPEFGGAPEPDEADGNHEPDELAVPAAGQTDPALGAAARHALHDEELVAAYAAGALEAEDPEDVARARSLVERCSVCHDLHADLLAIASAHRATAAMVLAASRDYRLSEDDAERLRPGVALVRAAPEAAAAEAAAVQPAAAAPAGAAALPGDAVAPRRPAGPSLVERIRAIFWPLTQSLGGSLVAAGLVGIVIASASLAAVPVGTPSSPAFGTQEGGNPAPTGDVALVTDDRSSGFGVGPATPDVRVVAIGVSGGAVLLGLVLLVRSRRRARESL